MAKIRPQKGKPKAADPKAAGLSVIFFAGLPWKLVAPPVLLGGAAGRYVAPHSLDLVLDHESVLAAGLSLGSGPAIASSTRSRISAAIRPRCGAPAPLCLLVSMNIC